MLYYNVGTGTVTAGQTMAGFFSSQFSQFGAIYAHLMCVFVPGLNSRRLAVYIVVTMHTGTFRFEVPILQGSLLLSYKSIS